jgi:hypothetical protein
VVVAVMLAVVLVLELGIRLLASHLPEPLVWHSYETQRKVHQMDELAKKGGADIVFVGSSMMDTGLEPNTIQARLGGRTVAYNASLASSIPRMTELWALDVVLPRLHPKVLVLGVDSFDLADTPSNRTVFYDAFVRSAGGRGAIGRDGVLQKTDRWLSDRLALWNHRFELRDPKAVVKAVFGRPPAQDREAAALEANGRQTLGQDQQFVDRAGLDTSHWALGTKDSAAIDRLIARAESRGTKVVLVDLPVTNEFVARHPHGQADYDTFRTALQAQAHRDGAELILMDSLRDESLFGDELHLNRRGAQVFSTELAHSLQSLPVHR